VWTITLIGRQHPGTMHPIPMSLIQPVAAGVASVTTEMIQIKISTER